MIESTYRNLVAWQRAVELVVNVYEMTKNLPSHERYGVSAQIRSAALSVPCYIAEDRGRGTRRDFRHFLIQARGSIYELETIIYIAERVGYLSKSASAALAADAIGVIRPLNGLIKSLSD